MDKVNHCILFLNCFLYLYPHIIFNFLQHSCSPEMKITMWLYHWYYPPNSLTLVKFFNTIIIIIIIIYFTYSIVFTTSQNQFLNLCFCNHWSWSVVWSVVVRLVCFSWTLQPWLRFSDGFYLYIWFSNNILFIYYHILVFVALFRTKKISSWIFGNKNSYFSHKRVTDKSHG